MSTEHIPNARCFFCDAVLVAGVECERLSCRRYDHELREEMESQHRRERWLAVGYALLQWARHSDECKWPGKWSWGRLWRRAFYTVKAILCVWTERRDYDYRRIDAIATWGVYSLCGEYSGVGWSELKVGEGILKNWWYCIDHTTSV